MLKSKIGRILIMLGIGLGLVTAAEGLKAQGRGKTHFYVADGQGQYRLEGVYSVDPQVALRGYDLEPAASKAGSGAVFLKSGPDEAKGRVGVRFQELPRFPLWARAASIERGTVRRRHQPRVHADVQLQLYSSVVLFGPSRYRSYADV
jgi:hypothetical protein